MTTPLLDDDTIIALTTDVTVYEGCGEDINVVNPPPPVTPPPVIPPAEDFIPFLVTIIE